MKKISAALRLRTPPRRAGSQRAVRGRDAAAGNPGEHRRCRLRRHQPPAEIRNRAPGRNGFLDENPCGWVENAPACAPLRDPRRPEASFGDLAPDRVARQAVGNSLVDVDRRAACVVRMGHPAMHPPAPTPAWPRRRCSRTPSLRPGIALRRSYRE
ncbi:MAG: hypothetical protein WKG07_15430 [Hymenobacter sp.]